MQHNVKEALKAVRSRNFPIVSARENATTASKEADGYIDANMTGGKSGGKQQTNKRKPRPDLYPGHLSSCRPVFTTQVACRSEP